MKRTVALEDQGHHFCEDLMARYKLRRKVKKDFTPLVVILIIMPPYTQPKLDDTYESREPATSKVATVRSRSKDERLPTTR
jgi:hypothetical protein